LVDYGIITQDCKKTYSFSQLHSKVLNDYIPGIKFQFHHLKE